MNKKSRANSFVHFDLETIKHYTPIVEPLPPPPAEYGTDLICIPIDRNYITYIVTALQIYAQKDTWAGDLETQRWAKGQINRLWMSIAQLESCENTMFDLRENPTDECEIQKSTDGGMTWVYAWRKDNCAPKYSEAILNVSLASSFDIFITNALSIYNDNPANLYPETIYQEDGGNNYRDVALCHAIRGLVDICANAAIESINDLNIWLNVGKAVLAITATVLSGGTSALAVWLLFGTSIARGALEVFSFATLGAAEAYEDEESRQVLACAMFEALYGETMTFARFNAALEAFTPSGLIQPLLKHAIEPFLQKTDVYITFLRLMNDLIPYAKVDLIENCDCMVWTVERLGGDGNANMVSMLIDGATATYNSTLDRYEGAASAGKRHLLVMMESPLVPFFVTSIGCNLTIDNNGTVNTHNYIADTNGEGTVNAQLTVGTNFVDGAHTLGVNDVDTQMLGIAFRLECQGTAGFVRLNKVSITGRGFNPFA